MCREVYLGLDKTFNLVTDSYFEKAYTNTKKFKKLINVCWDAALHVYSNSTKWMNNG